MRYRSLPHFCLSAALLGGMAASAYAFTYVVKEGDSLSTIAARTLQGRIYGKEGGIQKLVALNPEIENPNFILPGQEIRLAPEDAALASESPAASEPEPEPEREIASDPAPTP